MRTTKSEQFRMARRCAFLSLLCFLTATATLRSEEPVLLKGLQDIKKSTVFIKVDAGEDSCFGSGFLIRVEGNSGFLVTNHHVVSPSAAARPFNPRIPRFPTPTRKPAVTVIFGSGTKNEKSFPAVVVASDSDRDLALLKVTGLKEWPTPIRFDQAPKLVETMPVFVCGFPFGDALSLSKRNPSITIGKGSVSSMRENDRGELIAVQIDGALNPGNSGGPVVDSEGRLVGVAVATIRGSGIGLAIPPGQLVQMLHGCLGSYHLAAHKVDDSLEVKVEMGLIDPLEKIKEVTLYYVKGDPFKNKQRSRVKISSLPDSQKVDLTVKDQKAVGTFRVPTPEKGDVSVAFQVVYVNGDGKTILTYPRPYRINPQAPPVVVASPTTPVAEPPGPGQAVTVKIEKVPDDASRKVILGRLTFYMGSGSRSVRSHASGSTMVVTLTPVKDPKDFASKIDFGKVTRLEGREIDVVAGKIDVPSPNASLTEKALFDLKSPDEFTRRGAADTLAQQKPGKKHREEVAAALQELLKSKDGFTRTSAVKALASWGTKDSVPAVIERLEDESFSVRWAVLETLGKLKDARAAEPVARSLSANDRNFASKALQEMGSVAEKAVVPYLAHKDWAVRLEACKILKAIGTKECLAALKEKLKDENGIVKREAENAVQFINDRE